jgi:putative hydrolase of the HAD superfamily
MPRSFDAVLFDFGGVLIDSPLPSLQRAILEIGADPEQLFQLIFGPEEEDTDHPWHRLERGELPMAMAHKELIALCQRSGIDADPFQLLSKALGPKNRPKQAMVNRVRELRGQGCRTALVTNNVREVRESWWATLPLDELFDIVVDSSEIGLRKPDPEIYRRALELLGGIAPDRAIFLDDLRPNLDAAERLGMRGILVEHDPHPALQELGSLLDSRLA